MTRAWTQWALNRLGAEEQDGLPELVRFPLPADWNIDLYLLDESANPSGSLKHRLAKSLFTAAVLDGEIGPGSTIIEASSGSTAVSEAYFARLLGLDFIAVVPRTTSQQKINLIHGYGGSVCRETDPGKITERSIELAEKTGGYFMDQFSRASTVTNWRSPEGLAANIFQALEGEPYPEPEWIVVGVGTGGTSSSIGRYCRSAAHRTRLAIVDPEGSAYFDSWSGTDTGPHGGSRIEGIGRPGVEPSFIASIIDAAIRVDDAQSVAALRLLERHTGVRAGGSTGTNLSGALNLVHAMLAEGIEGSIVTLICDPGARYEDSYYSEDWLRRNGINYAPALAETDAFLGSGEWPGLTSHMTFRETRGTAGRRTPSATETEDFADATL